MADEAKRVCGLDDAQIEQLRVTGKYGKIGVVEYSGHQIVFRRPTRDQCREYRRQLGSPAEKHEAMEHLAQSMLVAFDGQTDANAARTTYTSMFLEAFPLFVNHPKVLNVISALAGLVEEEDAADLGKGASVRTGPPKSTPAA